MMSKSGQLDRALSRTACVGRVLAHRLLHLFARWLLSATNLLKPSAGDGGSE
jgi:hypothetical protein